MLTTTQLNAIGRLRHYPARRLLYTEGDAARYFYQLEVGVVRLFSYGERQDLVHQLVFPGETFSETIVCTGATMPYSVEALTEIEVWQVEQGPLVELLRTVPAVHWAFTWRLGALLHHQLQRNTSQALLPATEQIIWLVDYYVRRLRDRRQAAATACLHCEVCDRTAQLDDGYYSVPFTRQQIADMLGLRVETVMRAVKELAEAGRLRLLDHKVLYRLPQAVPSAA